jgi:hypothetical protein
MKYTIETASGGMICTSSSLDNQVRSVSQAVVLVLCRGEIYEVCC